MHICHSILFQNTPVPGSYHIRDFIEEASLKPVRMSYGFKDTGRNIQSLSMQRGTMLLPGAYSFTDCTQEALRHRASYSFKSCPRPDNYTLGIRDKVGYSSMFSSWSNNLTIVSELVHFKIVSKNEC